MSLRACPARAHQGAEIAEKDSKVGCRRTGRRWLLGRLARTHRFISTAAAFTGTGFIIFVLLWFQPQKLFLNETVSEPAPGVIQTATAGEANRNPTAGRSVPPALQVVRSGSFRSLEHATMGRAIVLRGLAGAWSCGWSTSAPPMGPTCGYTYPASQPVTICTPTGPDSSTWARSRATGGARIMPFRSARTCRHSTARSYGAVDSQSDSAWPRLTPELSRRPGSAVPRRGSRPMMGRRDEADCSHR